MYENNPKIIVSNYRSEWTRSVHVSSWDHHSLRIGLNYDAQPSFKDQLWVVGISDETLSWAFVIVFQMNSMSWENSKCNFVKITDPIARPPSRRWFSFHELTMVRELMQMTWNGLEMKPEDPLGALQLEEKFFWRSINLEYFHQVARKRVPLTLQFGDT